MKQIFTFLFTAIILVAKSQITYNGNTNTGFGGPVGLGSLTVADNVDSVGMVLQKGTNDLNDIIVIYIDSKSGGFTNTQNFFDTNDDLRKAISGKDGVSGHVSDITFNAGFEPDYAIGLQFGGSGFGGLFELVNGGPTSHIYRGSVSLTPTSINSPLYALNFLKSSIVMNGSFKFVVTYISNTAYRSDEAIGFNITGGNPAWNSITTDTAATFTSILPLNFISNFKGVINNNVAKINWQTTNETNLKTLSLQKNINNEWVDLAYYTGTGKSSGADYIYADKNIFANNIYRLKGLLNNGSIEYSEQISVKSIAKNQFDLYPTIIDNRLVNVRVKQETASVINIKIIGTNGVVINEENTTLSKGDNSFQTLLPKLKTGIYYINLSNNNSSKVFTVFVK